MDEPQVRVTESIVSRERGIVVQVDKGVFEAAFLCDMLGQAVYMQAYADGRLEVIHEG
jgi:hypothetical protein